MSKADFDVIVVGVGGHGSAALYHLAKRGFKVLGIEKFGVAHDRGSSHGESRIIRLAYHEHPDYVPLLKRAWDLWKDLEREAGQELLCETGCIETADPKRDPENCYDHALLAAREHNLDHEVLSGTEVNKRFPGYNLPAHFKAVLAAGGILASERCIEAHVQQAQAAGAELHTHEEVLSWQAPRGREGIVTVMTDKGQYTASKLVLSSGAWMAHLVPQLQAVLEVQRQVIGWFEVLQEGHFRKESFPVCVLEDEIGYFYIFPTYHEPGMKIGKFYHRHERVEHADQLSRVIIEADEQALRDAVTKFFPTADGSMLKGAACMFTNTQDHHFILDFHPAHEQVVLCSPCSGHGFKFASVVGEIVADLVQSGCTDLPIDLHRIKAERKGHAELLQKFGMSTANSKL